MKTIFNFLTLLILVTFLSCDSKKTDFKFAENPKLLACDFPNGDLLKEAVYSFENDIINTYDTKYKNITKAYSSFTNYKIRNSVKIKDIASEHSLKIAKALKEDTSLWATTNGTTSLNSSHPLIDCIANNIKDKDIKATFDALLATNSLKQNLILPLLSSSAKVMQADGSLKTYVAFELFYSQLLDVKLEDLKNPNPQPQPEHEKPAVKGVDLNKKPQIEAPKEIDAKKNAHAGHNHN